MVNGACAWARISSPALAARMFRLSGTSGKEGFVHPIEVARVRREGSRRIRMILLPRF